MGTLELPKIIKELKETGLLILMYSEGGQDTCKFVRDRMGLPREKVCIVSSEANARSLGKFIFVYIPVPERASINTARILRMVRERAIAYNNIEYKISCYDLF